MIVLKIDSLTIRCLLRVRAERERGVPARYDRTTRTVVIDPAWDPFAEVRIGKPWGPYGELILRKEICEPGTRPDWFNPKEHVGHLAMHHPSGKSLYVEFEANASAREEEHPFDKRIVANAIPLDPQLTLF